MKNRGDGIVYSTDGGRKCPDCGKRAADCECSMLRPLPVPDGGDVRVFRETVKRRGKIVTMVTGLPLPPSQLKELAKEIKAKCGAGGTVREGAIVIQGDHVEKLIVELGRLGWPATQRRG